MNNLKFPTRAIVQLAREFDLVVPDDWSLQDVWPLLDRVREDGAIVLLKLDGLRSHNHYTVVVSGGLLEKEDVIRTDAPTIEEAICFGLCNYGVRGWKLSQVAELGKPLR